MKKLYLSVLMSLATITLLAQTQQGVSYRYNGKHPRTPLGNVTISYDGNQRTTLSKENSGEFTLTLTGHQMGDRIGRVTVKKRDMMVFNQHAVDEWSVRKEPLFLILCNADEFERQKDNLIAIGKREVKKKYDRQKADLERQLTESRIKLQEYEAKLDKAYEELKRARQHIEEYADLFARIDESEIDSLAQRAIELFNHGEVAKAVELFEQGNYMEKLKQDKNEIDLAEQLKEKAEKIKEKAIKSREAHLRNLVAQVNAYKMKGDFLKAGMLMKSIADLTQTVDYLTWYAEFCNEQRYFEQAEAYWQQAIDKLETEQEVGSEEYEHRKSIILRELGTALVSQKKFEEGKQSLSTAIAIHKKLVLTNPKRYERGLSTTLKQLGAFYENIRDYKAAVHVYIETLGIDRHIIEYDSSWKWSMSLVLNNLGLAYMRMGRYNESLQAYEEAKSIQQTYLSERPNWETGKFKFAGLLFNIGVIYQKLHQYEYSKEAFLQSIQMFDQLRKLNPDAYTAFYGMALAEYADFNHTTYNYAIAEEQFEEAIELYCQLEEEHPLVYSEDLARILAHYGHLCASIQKYKESEEAFIKSYNVRKKLANLYPDVYTSSVVLSLQGLVGLARQSKQFEKGGNWIGELLSLSYELASKDLEKHEADLGRTLAYIGNFYGDAGKMDSSIIMLQEAVKIYRRMVLKLPSKENSLALALFNLGITYNLSNRYADSEQTFKECLATYKHLSKKQTGNYEVEEGNVYYELGAMYFAWKKYKKAIASLQTALAIYQDISSRQESMKSLVIQTEWFLSSASLYAKQFEGAETYARNILRKDSTIVEINTNLAAALLFQGKYQEAKKIYLQYKKDLNQKFLRDINESKQVGLIPKEYEADVENIKRILNE